MNIKQRYIYFPLHLISYIHTSPKKAIRAIICYGIVQYSEKFFSQLETYEPDLLLREAYKQVIYAFYRNKLSLEIAEWIGELIKSGDFSSDHEKKGFEYSEFEPDEEIEVLTELWNGEPEKQEACLKFYKISLAIRSLGLTAKVEQMCVQSESVFAKVKAFEAIHGPDPKVSIKVSLISDFYKNDKNVHDYELFAAYCAIKSIIGVKKYANTNKQFIACRMVGAKNYNTYESLIKLNSNGLDLVKIYTKYTFRYHADKLLNTLVDRRFLTSKIGIKSTKNLYVSCSMSYNDLAVEIGKIPSLRVRREENQKKEKAASELVQKLWRERISNNIT